MRFVSGLVLSAAVLALTVGCGKKDSTSGPNGGGSSSIEGEYIITGIEMAGEKMPDELFAKGKEEDRVMKVTADKMIMKKGGKDDPASYTLDKSKTPANIDMVGKKFDGKDEKMYGIYKIDGDKLIIVAIESEKAEDRPKDFKTEKNSKAMMLTLTKKK